MLQPAGGGGGEFANAGIVSAQSIGLSQGGITSLSQVRDLLFNQNGKLDRGAIIALNTPGKGLNAKAKIVGQALYNVADTFLRLRTGAQANPTEIQRLAEELYPGITDNEDVVNAKLGTYEMTFNNILDLARGQ
jgi:hypothetical protein